MGFNLSAILAYRWTLEDFSYMFKCVYKVSHISSKGSKLSNFRLEITGGDYKVQKFVPLLGKKRWLYLLTPLCYIQLCTVDAWQDNWDILEGWTTFFFKIVLIDILDCIMKVNKGVENVKSILKPYSGRIYKIFQNLSKIIFFGRS